MIVSNSADSLNSVHHPTKMPMEPLTRTFPQSVDSMMAEEFLSLSFQDRNAINEEMHGVSCLMPEETPDLIRASLEKLENELSFISDKDKKMYNVCREKYGSKNSSEVGGSYVNDVDFRLRFLRSELFDAKSAAGKLVIFLNVVVELFGEFALQRPIRLSDFSEDELQIIRCGNLQLLPFRDRSGRRIITGVEGLAIQFAPDTRIKILYYLMWVAGEDVETQLKGIVVIIWPVTDIAIKHLKNKERMVETQGRQLMGSSVRVAAFHFCVPDNPIFQVLRIVFAMTLNKAYRSRLKFHVGQVTELQYKVKSYGVPVDHIPLTGTGNVKTQNLRVWLKVRSTLEDPKGEPTDRIVECPGSNDVLFRPSKLIKGHPGNVKFHSLIEYYHEKGMGITAASKQIIADIFADKGRILIWDKRGWWSIETDPGHMQFKVSVSYRDYKKKNRVKTQHYNSSTFAFQDQDGKKRKRKDPSGAQEKSSSTTTTSSTACDFFSGGGSVHTPLIRW